MGQSAQSLLKMWLSSVSAKSLGDALIGIGCVCGDALIGIGCVRAFIAVSVTMFLRKNY